ncbi:23S rRNA (adenine(2503)-C(2))-methyltransferase RlmN [Tissierella sp. Yu-01]|uniref:23S rRNA (adenine(2503)-C(2))-methyltransferase RlmN n=1 Tax=Tissierella sp. Yu-01 TaxID=3035694 RepID=UPI00240D9060|nr:23S rRNA (adenine(2503)-C(2))-methyltransferase RlmN [Tissierella sp. Yu-01]WFA09812.1 23S rRNA (adenine(2503)-C(2))-methyltransferase RlmN [Tissierella sp. Yu-01]
MNRIELNSMTLDELKNFMIKIDEKSYRGEQVFTYFNRNKNLDINSLNQLSKDLKKKILEISYINRLEIFRRFDSKIDNTKKYLFILQDKNIIESVFMEYKHGNTACISTQVGCRMGCKFCASTKEGLIRNLTPAEMVNQIYMMEKDTGKDISNVVLMGSGEPLDNYDNVLKFINIIHDEKGHNMSLRNITLSTSGIVPKIYELAKENLPITLSISLHSPFDDHRSNIMPIAKRYSIAELMKACKYYGESTKRRLTFEYTLIENINDGENELKELSRLLKDINAHVNLIPLNPIKEYPEERPNKEHVERFQYNLLKRNIPVTIRREMGSDISASCGQLRRSITDKE